MIQRRALLLAALPLLILAAAIYWRWIGPVGQAELTQLLGILQPSIIVIGCVAAQGRSPQRAA